MKPTESIGDVPEVKIFHPSMLHYQNNLILFNMNGENSTMYSITSSNCFKQEQKNTLHQHISHSNTSFNTILIDKEEQLIFNLRQLFKERLFPDIIFEVEQEKIPAHKAILASRSDYFRRMLTSLFFPHLMRF